MKKIKINWTKLDDYNSIISKNISKKLPKDYHLTLDDIKSEVNGTFVSLIRLYRDKQNGMSLTSYCWRFAEQYTLKRILTDYHRIKHQIQISDLEDFDEDESGVVHHQYGRYEIPQYEDLDKQLETSDLVKTIINKADKRDQMLMRLIMSGMTLDAIAGIVGISKQAISKRLRKYGEKII